MEKSLKSILHVGKYYPPYSGGMETHLRDLAVRQVRWGRVSVIVANTHPGTDLSQMDGVDLVRVPRLGIIASMPICPTLPFAIHSRPSEIVHLHMPNPGGALAFLLSGHEGRLIITHHSDTLGRQKVRRLSDPFVKAVMKRASSIIVTSQRYLESSEELAPYLAKCRIIPLGIETDRFAQADARIIAEIQSLYGGRIVLAIGRLVPYKGFDVLIRSMKHVDGKLLLIGKGPQEKELRELIDREKLGNKIQLLGKVDSLGPYYHAAALFALPSVTRAEAFGLVQLEAMASGLPVINTSINSGVPELSIHSETGFTVPPNDGPALGRAIQRLLDDEPLRRRFAAAGRLRVEQNFTADQMASRILALYRQVLSNKPR